MPRHAVSLKILLSSLQNGIMNEQTNEGVYVGCSKILYNSPMNIYMKFVSEIFKLM